MLDLDSQVEFSSILSLQWGIWGYSLFAQFKMYSNLNSLKLKNDYTLAHFKDNLTKEKKKSFFSNIIRVL